MGIRIGGGIGPVRVSTGIGGAGCLAWFAALMAAVVVFCWPWLIWETWAAEGPYLAVLVLGSVGLWLWLRRAVKRSDDAERIRLNRQFGLPDDHMPPC